MKPILISSLTLIILVFSELVFAQQLHIAYLNQSTGNYVNPLELKVEPGDQIKFLSTGGNFNITIPNANTILLVKVHTLNISLSALTQPESQIYTVRDVDDIITQEYQVDCTSGGGLPTAPPRIIIIGR